jgi:hypothetical protein
MADIYARIQDATEHELRTVLAGLCADSDSTKTKTARLFDRLNQVAEDYNAQRLPAPRPAFTASAKNHSTRPITDPTPITFTTVCSSQLSSA